MKNQVKTRLMINEILESTGYKITSTFDQRLKGFDDDFLSLWRLYKKYTNASIERSYSLYKAIEYLNKANIQGDIVECGVWRGGSMMLAAGSLLGMAWRPNIYLYDTFSGMTKPGDKDLDFKGCHASKKWWQEGDQRGAFGYAELEEVKTNVFSTGYPKERFIFVKGKVEETLPETIPEKISLLRLDTDWYESTYHELVHLFPKITSKGVLLIDDYDFFKGQREAVDRYFHEKNINMLLIPIDHGSRLGICG